MKPIFIIVPPHVASPDDSAKELLAAAKALDPIATPIAVICGLGPELDAVSGMLAKTFPQVWTLASEAFAGCNAEAIRPALSAVLPRHATVLLTHDHFALDLAPGLSIGLDTSYIPDVLAIQGPKTFVRQEFNGQFNARVECTASSGTVATIRPGCFKLATPSSEAGVVTDKSAEIPAMKLRRRYITTISAPAGDVDITRHAVLVSVGRGIQEQENISLAQKLADLLGGAVSCSRPVVDAKWLDKSRQVGSSGATVQPKIYLACGISGSFQHMTGIKGAPFLVAINKNPAAPIFQFADVGVVDDVLEFLPALTARVREVLAKATTAVAS